VLKAVAIGRATSDRKGKTPFQVIEALEAEMLRAEQEFGRIRKRKSP
jgi:hypothetical protein